MRTLIIVLFAYCALLTNPSQSYAQGVRVWKDGVCKTILSSDVDSLVFFAGEEENDPHNPSTESAKRTVLVYASAENNLDQMGLLYGERTGDVDEMLRGRYDVGDNNLLVYIDRYKKNEPPYIIRITPNGQETVKQYEQDFYSSDPDRITDVVRWTTENYPAQSYGLVLWGHANGFLIESDTLAYAETTSVSSRKRAYGLDYGTDHEENNGLNGSKWINIPTLSKALYDALPSVNGEKQKFDFIFFDCCNMQSVEVAYELRNVTDYVIGSPAEIPAYGAPYEIMVKDFFLEKDDIGKSIVNDYIDGNLGVFNSRMVAGLPMSSIKTSELNSLAEITAAVLSQIQMKNNEIDTDGCIYYMRKRDRTSQIHFTMFDMRNVIRRNLISAGAVELLDVWEDAFGKAVFSRCPSEDRLSTYKNVWETVYPIQFNEFNLSDESFGGVTMFVPKEEYKDIRDFANPNMTIFGYEWTKIVNWHQFGW